MPGSAGHRDRAPACGRRGYRREPSIQLWLFLGLTIVGVMALVGHHMAWPTPSRGCSWAGHAAPSMPDAQHGQVSELSEWPCRHGRMLGLLLVLPGVLSCVSEETAEVRVVR